MHRVSKSVISRGQGGLVCLHIYRSHIDFGCAALNAYMPRPKVTDGVNLLSGKNDDGKEATQVGLK